LPEEEIEAEVPTAEEVIDEAAVEEELVPTVVRERVLASPAAKRLAREHDVDLIQILGTGPDGRIVEEDVKRFLQDQAELMPKIREEFPLTGIRKTTAERLASSFRTAPHSFIIMDVDVTKAAKLRETIQVSFTSILVYAVTMALREHITVNSTLVDGKIRVFEDINIGVAVSTDKGLLVPVIHNTSRKQLEEISSELENLVEKARKGKLSREELTGGTFTLTNLGMFEVDMFLPIINLTECAILAAGRAVEKPIVVNKEIEIKPIMALTLAYDHRIIDGAPASVFLRRIKEIIEKELK